MGTVSVSQGLGDASDIEAAVAAAVSKCNLAVAGISREPGLTRFRLLSLNGQPGELIARFSRSEPDTEIRFEARVGRFGDPASERELLDRVRARLTQLRGVSVAPLPW